MAPSGARTPIVDYGVEDIASLVPLKPVPLVFATSEADDAGGLNAVVTVGSEALLLLRRGYADPALRPRPAPGFEVARGLSAETLSALLLANLEPAARSGRSRM